MGAAAGVFHNHGLRIGLHIIWADGHFAGITVAAELRRHDHEDSIDIARNYLRRFADLTEPPKTLADLDFEKHKVRLAPVDALPDYDHDGRRMEGFAKSNGKLLLYHSWSDDSLTPSTALDVYNAHTQAFGGAEKLDPFFRTFVVPGMYHCRGGEGPDAVDFLSAMEAWVEKGEAPTQLIASKPKHSVPLPGEYRLPMPPDQILFSRPVYQYPATAVYSGQGDAKAASSWRKKVN